MSWVKRAGVRFFIVRLSAFLLLVVSMVSFAVPTYAESLAINSAYIHSYQLGPNQSLYIGGSIFSENGLYELTLQTDGNLVLYEHTYNNYGQLLYRTAIWASNTDGKYVSRCTMQSDGNLVIYYDYYVYSYYYGYTRYSRAVWATGTDGHPDSYLSVQYDGNLVIYQPESGTAVSEGDVPADPIWASGTQR